MNMLDFGAAAGRTDSAGRRSWRSSALALICAAGLLGSATMASAEAGDMASEAGLGLGAVLVSLVYGPVKVLYATRVSNPDLHLREAPFPLLRRLHRPHRARSMQVPSLPTTT